MLRALVTFHADGTTVYDGSLVDEKDPIVKGRESLFVRADDDVVVEEATAVPGQRRRTSTRKAKD